LMMPSQVSGTLLAKGVTAPKPVITTRRVLTLNYRKNLEAMLRGGNKTG
jgi:hypothetical protein